MPAERHPDFIEGNGVAVKHGAYSPAEIEQRAEVVHGRLLEVCPYLAEDRYAPSVDRYAKASAREALAHEALVSMEPGARGFTRLMETATAASRLAWLMGDALGLTPGGHARLQLLVAGAAEAEDAYGALQKHLRSTYGEGEDVDA